jgi:hypothetical protein
MTYSIVAVHGLNPTNKEDHAQATWTASNNKMWLKDFLPSQLPTARILLFGYNANVAFETSIAGVTEYAENLLNRLRGKRRVPRTAMTRPIIFVCHSLGGIITKKALTIAKLDPTYDTIGKAWWVSLLHVAISVADRKILKLWNCVLCNPASRRQLCITGQHRRIDC